MVPQAGRTSLPSVPPIQQRQQQQQQQQQMDAAEYYGLYKTARTLARSYQAVAHQKDDQVKALTREMEELKLKLQKMEAEQQRLTAGYQDPAASGAAAPANASSGQQLQTATSYPPAGQPSSGATTSSAVPTHTLTRSASLFMQAAAATAMARPQQMQPPPHAGAQLSQSQVVRTSLATAGSLRQTADTKIMLTSEKRARSLPHVPARATAGSAAAAPQPPLQPLPLPYGDVPMPPPVLAPSPALMAQNTAGMFVRSARSARVTGEAWSARYSEPPPPGGFEDPLMSTEDPDLADGGKAKKSKERSSITKAFKKLMSKSWRGSREDHGDRAHEASGATNDGGGVGGAANIANVTTDIFSTYPNYTQLNTLQQIQQPPPYPFRRMNSSAGIMETAPSLPLDYYESTAAGAFDDPQGLLGAPPLPTNAEYLSLALPSPSVAEPSLTVAAPSAAAGSAATAGLSVTLPSEYLLGAPSPTEQMALHAQRQEAVRQHQQQLLLQQQQQQLLQQQQFLQQQQQLVLQQQQLLAGPAAAAAAQRSSAPAAKAAATAAALQSQGPSPRRGLQYSVGRAAMPTLMAAPDMAFVRQPGGTGASVDAGTLRRLQQQQAAIVGGAMPPPLPPGGGKAGEVAIPRSAFGQFAQKIKSSVPAASMRRSYDGVLDGGAAAAAAGGLYASGASVNQSWSSEGPTVAMAGHYPAEMGTGVPPPIRTSAPVQGARAVLSSQVSLNIRAAAAQLSHLPPRPMGRSAAGSSSNATAFSAANAAMAPGVEELAHVFDPDYFPVVPSSHLSQLPPELAAYGAHAIGLPYSSTALMPEEAAEPVGMMHPQPRPPTSPPVAARAAHGNVDASYAAATPNRKQAAAAAPVMTTTTEAYLEDIFGRLKTPSVLFTPTAAAAQVTTAAAAQVDRIQAPAAVAAEPSPPPGPPPPVEEAEAAVTAASPAELHPVSTQHLTVDEAIQTETTSKAEYDAMYDASVTTPGSSTAGASRSSAAGDDDAVLRRDLRRSVGVGWRHKALGYKNAAPSPSFYEKPLTVSRKSLSGGILQPHSPQPSAPPVPYDDTPGMGPGPVPESPEPQPPRIQTAAAGAAAAPAPAASLEPDLAAKLPVAATFLHSIRTSKFGQNTAAARAAELLVMDSPKAAAPPSSPTGTDDEEAYKTAAENSSPPSSHDAHRHHHRHHHHRHHRHRHHRSNEHEADRIASPNKSERRTAVAGGGGGGGSRSGSDAAVAGPATATEVPCAGDINDFRTTTITATVSIVAGSNAGAGGSGGGGNVTALLQSSPLNPRQRVTATSALAASPPPRKTDLADQDKYDTAGTLKMLPTTKTTATSTTHGIATTVFTATMITTGHVPSADVDCQPGGDGGRGVGGIWLTAPVASGSCSGGTTGSVSVGGSVKVAQGSARYAAAEADEDSSSAPTTSRSENWSADASPRHPYDQQRYTRTSDGTKTAAATAGLDNSATLVLAAVKLAAVRKTAVSASSGLVPDATVGLASSMPAAAVVAAAGPVTRSTCLLPNAADVALSDYPSARSNPSASARLLEGMGGGHSGGATPSSSSRHVSVTLAPSPSPPVSASDSSVGSWEPNPNSRRGGSNNGGNATAAACPTRKGVTVAAAAPGAAVTSGAGLRHQNDTASATAAALRLQQNLVEISSKVVEPLAARKRGAVRRRSLSTGLDASGAVIESAVGTSAAQLMSAGRGEVAAAAAADGLLLAPRNCHRRWRSVGHQDDSSERDPAVEDDELSARTAQSTTIGAPPTTSASAVTDTNDTDKIAVFNKGEKGVALRLQAVEAAADSQLTDCSHQRQSIAASDVIQSSLRRSTENMDEQGSSKAAKAHVAQQQHLQYLQQRQQLLQQRQQERFERQRSAKVIQRAWRMHLAAKAAEAAKEKEKAATAGQHQEEKLRREQAAIVIQRGWHVYRRRTAAAIVPSPALPLASPPVTPIVGRTASAASSAPGTPVLVLLPLSQQQPVCVRVPSARMCSSGGLKRRLFHPVTYSLDGLGQGPVLDTNERLRLLRGSLSKSEGGWSASMDESVFVQQPELLRRSSSTGGASPTLYAPCPQPSFILPENADDDVGGAPSSDTAAAAVTPAVPAAVTPVVPPPPPLAAPLPVRASLDLLSVETAAAALSVTEVVDSSDFGQGWPVGLTIRCPSSPPRDLTGGGGGSGVLISAASPNTQPPSATSPKPPNPLASPMYFGNDVVRTAGTDSDLVNGRSRSRVISGGVSGPRPIGGHNVDIGARDRPMGRSGSVSLISASWDGGRMLPERRMPSMESAAAVRRSDGGGSSGGGSGGGGGFVESLRAMRTDVSLLAQLAGVAMDNCLGLTDVKPPPPPPLAAQQTPKHHQQPPLPPPQQQQQTRAAGRDELVRTPGGLPPPHSQPRQPPLAAMVPAAPSPSWASSPSENPPNVPAAVLGPSEPSKLSGSTGTAAGTQPSMTADSAAVGTPDSIGVPVAPSPDGFCRTGADELAEFEAIEAAVAAASSGSSRERQAAVVASGTAGDYSGDEDDALITSSRCFTTTPPTARLLSCGSSSDEEDGVQMQLGLEHVEMPSVPPPPPPPPSVAATLAEEKRKPDGDATATGAAAAVDDVSDDDSDSDESLSALCQPLPSARTPAAYGTSRLAIGIGSPATISTTTSASTMAGDEGISSSAAEKGCDRGAGGDAINMPSPVRWHTSELWEIAHLHPMTPTPVATPTEAAADTALRRSWPCPRPAAPPGASGANTAPVAVDGVGPAAESAVSVVDAASIVTVRPWTTIRNGAGGASIGGGPPLAVHGEAAHVAVFAEHVPAVAVDYTMSEPAICSSPMAVNIQRTTRTSSPVRWHTSQLWEIVNQPSGGGITPPPLMTPRDGNSSGGGSGSSCGGVGGPSMVRRAWSAPQAVDFRPPVPVVTTTAVAAVATVTTSAVAAVATATATTAAVAPVAPTPTTAAGGDGAVASLPTGVTISVSAPGVAPLDHGGPAAKATTVPSAAIASGGVSASLASATTVARSSAATITPVAAAPPLAPAASAAVTAAVPPAVVATAAPAATKVPVEIKRTAGSPTSSPPLFSGFSTVGGVKAASPSFGYVGRPQLTISHHRFDDIVTCAPPPPTPSTPPPPQAAVVSSAAAAAPSAAAPGVHVLSGDTVGGLKLSATLSRPKVPSPGPSLDISEPPAQQPPAAPAPVPSVTAGTGASGACGGGTAASNPVNKATTAVTVAVAATTPNVSAKTTHTGSGLGSGGGGGGSAKSIPTAPAVLAAVGGALATKTSSASPSTRGLSRIPSFSTPNATTTSSRPSSAEKAEKVSGGGGGGGGKSRSSSPSSAQASTTTSIPSATKSGCTPANAATATRPDSQRRPALGQAVTNVAVAATATATATAAPVAVLAAPVAAGGTTAIAATTAGATSPESRLVMSSSSNSSDLTGTSFNLPSYDSATTIAYIMPKSAHSKAGSAPAPAAAGAATDCAVTEKGSAVVGVLYPTPGVGQVTAPVAIPAPPPQSSTGGLQERRRYTSSPSVTGTRMSSPLTAEAESDASPRLGLPPNNTFQPSSSVGRRFSVGFSLPISSDISGDGDGDGDGDGGSADNGESTPCSVQQQQKPSFQFYHNPHFDSGLGAAISAASKPALADGDVKGLHHHQGIVNVTDILSRHHRRSSSPPRLAEDALKGRERFTELVDVPVALTGSDKIRSIQAAASAAGMMDGSGAAAAAAAAANRLRSSSSRREQADAEAFCLYGGLALPGDSSDSENI
ncbi:hypothetical protein VaNZ11_007572 [Volvox africanus]|uniref:Uncharacterized protein n=1 Tax=Volvox africanus TaxID=51714 RepID=A0ABQ5S369_9CHLO|nr:hypothetical protein VaNZ11_007572 [Volvox africanus]